MTTLKLSSALSTQIKSNKARVKRRKKKKSFSFTRMWYHFPHIIEWKREGKTKESKNRNGMKISPLGL
jgi:hypothetical protein